MDYNSFTAKNILLFSDNYIPEMNANARIFSELAELWAQMGCDVSVLTSHPNFPQGAIFPGYKNKWLSKERVNQVNIFRVKTLIHPNRGLIRRSLDFISFGISSFFCSLFIHKRHVIIGVTPQFFCALAACMLAVLRKSPFLLVLCDLWPDSVVANQIIKKKLLYRLIKKIELWMYRKAFCIAVLSENFKNYLLELGIPSDKIFLSISAPSNEFYPRSKNQALINHYALEHKFIVGFLGTLGISHGLDDLFTVAEQTRVDPKTHFLIVGDGIRRNELQQRAQANYPNITVDGPFPGDQMPEYWSVIDVALVSLANTVTNKTVLPSKILESMAMGIPVILYAPEGEAQRFLAEANAGWYIPVGDCNALTDLITQLSHHPELITEQKQKAVAFSANYSREIQAKKILEQIESFKHTG